MNNINILWVDDEIDLLKPHILFLEQKNYQVTTCQSGQEAIDEIGAHPFDIFSMCALLLPMYRT